MPTPVGTRQITAKRYEAYLETVRNHKGEELAESTIEKYVGVFKDLLTTQRNEPLREPETAVQEINVLLRLSKSYMMYASSKHLFEWLGYEDYWKELEKPAYYHKSLNSKKFLQTMILSRNEILRLITECNDKYLELAMRLLYDTGCRRSEICSVKWKHIKLYSERKEEDKKHIERGVYGSIPVVGKGGKHREVYITKSTWMFLRKQHLEEPYSPDDFLVRFKKRRGDGWISDNVTYLYKYLRRAGKEILDREISPHNFRHTRASHMADAGADLLDIQAYLGHESVETTEIYVEISSHRARLAFQKYIEGI